ncbi:uncharacterized protein AC631_05833 [Debaryomyces fabryi]|uniref:Uncharacterized protein n=1 Tax=Debaryomyces fabryi TaxID=58627 RepID=A0A0V1PQ82_9ASCO|nr:uncharacterized protein AC631_05833 [Debaryomyces fabryi]KRZ98405.1 hypothetical protein AC631_05833 [Debaryomyces fabryi]
MSNWFKSNLPWKAFAGFVLIQVSACLLFGADGFAMLIVEVPGVFVCMMVSYMPLKTKFREIIEEILIPEFIEKRPFKEISLKRKETLDKMVINVNNKVNYMMGTNYGYTSADGMVRDYKDIMTRFEKKYHNTYKGTPDEEIQGWDKILLIAKNIQDEDLGCFYERLVPLEFIKKYSKNTTNGYELDNIGHSKDVSDTV